MRSGARRAREGGPSDKGESYGEVDFKEEELLGPATLAKMQSGELSFEEEAAAAANAAAPAEGAAPAAQA